ncbi:MAG: AMP-binding protein [Exilibacterium sp.]
MGHIFLTTLYQHSKGICVPGYEVKLVDIKYDNKSRSKRGVSLVKGPSQSLGYYKNKERTMEKFDSDGWYRTGDIFSQDEKGFYKFESREDDLFKVKGRWVCPNEMESFVLSNFKTIVDTALIKTNQSLTDEELGPCTK